VGDTHYDHGLPASLAGDRFMEGEFELLKSADIQMDPTRECKAIVFIKH
jgi:hypothetical protein